MTCPNCGSPYVSVQAVAERKRRGCLMAGLWVILAIFTFGAIIWIPILIRKGDKVRSWAVCQSCGYRWVMDNPLRPVQYAAPITPQHLSNEPRFDTLVPNVKTALGQLLSSDIGVSENEKDWTITRSGLSYRLESNIKVNRANKQACVDIDFPDATYESFNVSGIQLDGEQIEF